MLYLGTPIFCCGNGSVDLAFFGKLLKKINDVNIICEMLVNCYTRLAKDIMNNTEYIDKCA